MKRAALLAALVMLKIGCAAPAAPKELNYPVCQRLVNANLVTIEVIHVNGVKTASRSLEKAIEGFSKYVGGKVRTVQGEPVELQVDENGLLTRGQLNPIIAKSRYRGPSDISILLVPGLSDYGHRGHYEALRDGHHLIVIQTKYLPGGVPPLVSREKWAHLVIKHELLHALGVPADRSHAWCDRHCTHPECILYPRPDARAIMTGILRLGPPMDLCGICRREIRQTQEAAGGKLADLKEPYDHLKWLDELVELNPDNPRAYAMRADEYVVRKDFKKATADYTKKIGLDSGLVGYSPLFIAAYQGHSEIVSGLLDSGADIDVRDPKEGSTPLMAAISKGHAVIARILLEKGADVHASATEGRTALFMAAGIGQLECAEMVLAYGADINASASSGVTPLIIAAWEGQSKMVSLLIEKGASIDTINDDGNTALVAAAHKGHKEIVERLINAGAGIDIANSDGVTVLMAAATEGHLDVVKLLLANGVDHNAEDKNGKTALNHAEENQHHGIIELLGG